MAKIPKYLKLEYKQTALGANVFVKEGAYDADGGIYPSEWTVAQLRFIADYMEANPDCSLYSDGSGHKVKLK